MLGNFSIGDYFKKEAIEWAWEFLTDEKWIGFNPEVLSVTVHPEDEEAYHYWLKILVLPEERIIRIEGNFWDIGEGPSGPNQRFFMIEEQNLAMTRMILNYILVEKITVTLKFGTWFSLSSTITQITHIRHYQRKTLIQAWD